MKSVSGEKQASSGRLSWYIDLDVLGLDEVELLKEADDEQRDLAGLEEVELPEGLLERRGDERRARAVLRRVTGGAGQLAAGRLFRAQCAANGRGVRGVGSGCAPTAGRACPSGPYRRCAATPSPRDAPSSRRGIGRACKGRCKSRTGLCYGARTTRGACARCGAEVWSPPCVAFSGDVTFTGSSNGGEPVRTWICTFARIKMSQTSRQFSQSSVAVLLTRTRSLYCMP